MSGDIGLGRLIEEPRGRDAVHIAVVPITAGEDLLPNDRIYVDGGYGYSVEGTAQDVHGIVDPFLSGRIKRGDTFYMCMFPGSITSLRHEWTHPALDSLPEETDSIYTRKAKIESKDWIMDFLHKQTWYDDREKDIEAEYSDLIDEWTSDGAYTFNDSGVDTSLLEAHLEVVTDHKKGENFYFSCSC